MNKPLTGIYALPFPEPVRYYTWREFLEVFEPHTLRDLEACKLLEEATLLETQDAHRTAKREGFQAIGDAFPAIVWKLVAGYDKYGWSCLPPSKLGSTERVSVEGF